MNSTDSVLTKYKDYLITLDYPFIKQTSDEQIKEIFSRGNRVFLLSWMVTNIIPAYQIRIELATKNGKIEQMLGNIIYENGFCRASEKEFFVQNGIEANASEQIAIFDRMFNMLLLLQSNDDKENLSEEENALKQIFMKPATEMFKDRITFDANLFPEFGGTKKVTDKEKAAKVKQLKEKIEVVKINIENSEKEISECLENGKNTVPPTEEEIENLIKKLRDVTNEVNNSDFGNTASDSIQRNNLRDNSELENLIKETSLEVSKLLQVAEQESRVHEIVQNKMATPEKASNISNDSVVSECIQQFNVTLGIILDHYGNSSEHFK